LSTLGQIGICPLSLRNSGVVGVFFLVLSCPECVSPPRSGSHRRSFRRDDRLWTSRRLRQPLDDMRFSNSLTVEHNVLGPGSIGHILRNSTFSTTTHARYDSWFHYDQVGSVVARSDDAATPTFSPLYSDAWGNRMSSYTTGEWTSTWASRDGWGHNTKEYDGDSGLVYMYQRWYQPELGVFMSQAPYPPTAEHQYNFAKQLPALVVDPDGRKIQFCNTSGFFGLHAAIDINGTCRGFGPPVLSPIWKGSWDNDSCTGGSCTEYECIGGDQSAAACLLALTTPGRKQWYVVIGGGNCRDRAVQALHACGCKKKCKDLKIPDPSTDPRLILWQPVY
jgi:RHS repeat-associated protein